MLMSIRSPCCIKDLRMTKMKEDFEGRARLYVATCSKCEETYNVAIYPANYTSSSV